MPSALLIWDSAQIIERLSSPLNLTDTLIIEFLALVPAAAAAQRTDYL